MTAQPDGPGTMAGRYRSRPEREGRALFHGITLLGLCRIEGSWSSFGRVAGKDARFAVPCPNANQNGRAPSEPPAGEAGGLSVRAAGADKPQLCG